MILSINNASTKKCGGIDTNNTYTIGKGEDNVSRVFR